MKGKERCRILKEIRKNIASENDIPFVVEECTHKGDCRGTCPKCESELRYLERELEKRQRLGRTVAIAGLTASIALTSSCADPYGTELHPGSPSFGGDIQGAFPTYSSEIDGDIAYPESGNKGVSTEELVLMGDIAFPLTEDGAAEGSSDESGRETDIEELPPVTEETHETKEGSDPVDIPQTKEGSDYEEIPVTMSPPDESEYIENEEFFPDEKGNYDESGIDVNAIRNDVLAANVQGRTRDEIRETWGKPNVYISHNKDVYRLNKLGLTVTVYYSDMDSEGTQNAEELNVQEDE